MWASSVSVSYISADILKAWQRCVGPLSSTQRADHVKHWLRLYKRLPQGDRAALSGSYYLIINIEPLRMMVHLLCLQSHSRHESKRLQQSQTVRISRWIITLKVLLLSQHYYSYTLLSALYYFPHIILNTNIIWEHYYTHVTLRSVYIITFYYSFHY